MAKKNLCVVCGLCPFRCVYTTYGALQNMPGWVLMHEEMVDGFVKCFDMGEIQTQKTDGMIWVLFKRLYKNSIYNLNNFYTFIFYKKFKG